MMSLDAIHCLEYMEKRVDERGCYLDSGALCQGIYVERDAVKPPRLAPGGGGVTVENPVFEESYRRLFGEGISIGEQAEDFFRDFYARFLISPEIAKQFEDVDLDRQVSMLRKSLYQLIAFYLFDEPSADLRRLAELHQRLGLTRSMFDQWLEALVATVEAHDAQFDEQVRLAWCWALSPGITYMKLALQPAQSGEEA